MFEKTLCYTLCQVVGKLTTALGKAALVQTKADSMSRPQVRGNYSFSNRLTWHGGQRTCQFYNTTFELFIFLVLVWLIVDPMVGPAHIQRLLFLL